MNDISCNTLLFGTYCILYHSGAHLESTAGKAYGNPAGAEFDSLALHKNHSGVHTLHKPFP